MPRSDFFRNLGLFVLDDFLEPRLCVALCGEMSCAASKQGKIVMASGEELTNESVRRVLRAKVMGPNELFVRDRLELIRPKLQDHFSVSLASSESAEVLVYREGGFYTPHTDAARDPHLYTSRRRVSVVVFLNGESEQPAQNCYGGGKLTFHGIVSEPPWANCAFSMDSHPGLLVAFRSDLVHEVSPVTFGKRFTIVSWFSGDGINN